MHFPPQETPTWPLRNRFYADYMSLYFYVIRSLFDLPSFEVVPPMTASFHSKVGIFTPVRINNYHVCIAKLIGFGRGAAPRAQIR